MLGAQAPSLERSETLHQWPSSFEARLRRAPQDDGRSGERARMNWRAVQAIYVFEMARTGRTIMQSIVSPVLSTSLYFVVFGAAIGSRINAVEGIPYGSFIVPGLIMLTILTQSTMNASCGIYFPRFTG